MLKRTLVLALLLGGSTLSAQQAPLVGTWRITYAGEMRMRNGVPDPVMVKGTLTVQTQGDSLIANLVTDSGAVRRSPLRLAAKTGAGDAVFINRGKATLNMNGQEREATVINTWTLGVKGDSLSGTLANKLEGIDGPTPPPQPVTGTRKRT